MAGEKDFLAQIAAIDAALPADGAAAFAAPSKDELCKIFNKIKGPIEGILPFVELIPIYGKAIAKALRLLLQFGAVVCPS